MRKRGTIVLIHGFLASYRTWQNLRYYLLWKGYNVVSPTLPVELKTIDPDAEKAAEYVHRYISFRRAESPIVLVGHSFGGLIAKQFYLKFHESYRIPAIVTIASPHRGVRWGRKIISFILKNMDLPAGKSVLSKRTLSNLSRTFSFDSPAVRKLDGTFYHDVRFLLIGAVSEMLRFLTPLGDGVVELDSQIPPWVRDRENVEFKIFHGVYHMNVQKVPQTMDAVFRFIQRFLG